MGHTEISISGGPHYTFIQKVTLTTNIYEPQFIFVHLVTWATNVPKLRYEQ
jgi:hypothetical protein